MSGKLIITRGLSGSGKTTWAKDYVAMGAPGTAVRVNRDDLRAMLHGGYVDSYEVQQELTAIQHNAIRHLLRRGRVVIADDTNLVLRHAKAFAKLAYEEDASFKVVDHFLQVPLETCIARDALRDPVARVGERVIRNQHGRFFPMVLTSPVPPYEPPPGLEVEPYFPDPSKPEAVVCDLDGTLAELNGRDPYDESTVYDDDVNGAVRELIENFMARDDSHGFLRPILFTSGRTEACRPDTERWLDHKASLPLDGAAGSKLFMRAVGDGRRDDQVKLDIFNTHIRDNYNVIAVIDDRQQVVDMWRKLGLTCLQAAPGNF